MRRGDPSSGGGQANIERKTRLLSLLIALSVLLAIAGNVAGNLAGEDIPADWKLLSPVALGAVTLVAFVVTISLGAFHSAAQVGDVRIRSSRARRFATVGLIVLGESLAAAAGVLRNVASGSVPETLKPYAPWAVLALTLVVIGVAVGLYLIQETIQPKVVASFPPDEPPQQRDVHWPAPQLPQVPRTLASGAGAALAALLAILLVGALFAVLCQRTFQITLAPVSSSDSSVSSNSSSQSFSSALATLTATTTQGRAPTATARPSATTPTATTAPTATTVPATLSVQPTTITLSTCVAAQTQFAVSNTGGAPLSWSATASVTGYSLSPTSGTLNGGTDTPWVLKPHGFSGYACPNGLP
jgi:hypothetical protein